MMRYQSLSPDSHTRKPIRQACSEDEDDDNGRVPNYSSSLEAKPLRARSASGSILALNAPSTSTATAPGPILLSGWVQKKRSRGPRDSRLASDESRQPIKIRRRTTVDGGVNKSAMPPPGNNYTRNSNLRPCTPIRDSSAPPLNKTVEDRSNGQKRSPPSPPEKSHKIGNGDTEVKMADREVNMEQLEWPRIYVSLSRKEKEDDFLAMKGTKLPHRPKKRAKNVDKSLQYCFPGMWLSDLTRGRYEVREKKCVKKKKRGLKGMESMDSDSE